MSYRGFTLGCETPTWGWIVSPSRRCLIIRDLGRVIHFWASSDRSTCEIGQDLLTKSMRRLLEEAIDNFDRFFGGEEEILIAYNNRQTRYSRM